MTLDELQTLREGWDFEAKLAHGRGGAGALPDSFWATYSAMANTEGGVILLGAKERPDHSLVALGIPDLDKLERDLWSTLENPSTVSVNLLGRRDVERVEVDDKVLLLVRVPKAPRGKRPVFLKGSWEQTYVRVYEGDHKVDSDVARRMLADAQPLRDSEVLEGYSFDDFDPDSVRLYREIFAMRRPEHPYLRHEGAEFLKDLRAWGVDRGRGREGPTRGGVLMFGREATLRDLNPHWHLSYQELPGDEEMHRRWLDRVAPDGTWEANVFTFYRKVFPKLRAGVKAPFFLDAGLFRGDEGPVHAALREALVNTLVHADYDGPAGVRVLQRPAGFEFVNPGLPLVSVEQVWRGGVSVTRNPTLQHLFALLGLGEREGSGGPAIRQAWMSQHWQKPVLRPDVETNETHLVLRQVSLLPQDSLDALREQWGQRFLSLDELGRLILVTAHAEGRISHARIRELTDEHSRDLTLKLQELVRSGFLEAQGERRGRKTYAAAAETEAPLEALPLFAGAAARLHEASDAVDPSAASGQAFPAPPFGSSPQSDLSSPQSDLSSPQSDLSSPQSGASSPQSGASSPQGTDPFSQPCPQSSAGSAGTTPQQEQAVVRVAESSWAASANLRAAITVLCRAGFLTVAELAGALNRKPRTIRENHLREMVRSGQLELRYPEQPHHPEQAYRTATPDEAP